MKSWRLLVSGLLSKTSARLDAYPKIKRAIFSALIKFPALDLRLRRMMRSSAMAKLDQVLLSEDILDANQRGEYGDDNLVTLPLPAGERTLYIYVDHTVSCDTNTGVQRVVRGLAVGLIQRGEKVRFIKWDAGSNQCVLINLSEREKLSRWNGPGLQDADYAIYPQSGSVQAPIQPHFVGESNWLFVPEVTHITFQAEPVTLDVILWARRMGLKAGFVFYDAIPLRREEFKDISPKHADYMRQLLLADVIWPISEWSANDLIAYWQISECADINKMPEVQAMPLPGESQLSKRALQPEDGGKIILSVGTIEPRKNQVALIRAFEAYRKKFPDSDWQLILVGNLHPLVAGEVLRATKADMAIRHLGHVSDAELDELYRSCAFTVFPSVEEGFGLPILESLWYGRPCLCANFGAMAEVARGGGCLQVDMHKQLDINAGIEQLANNAELRQALSKEAMSRNIANWGDYAASLAERVDREADYSRQLGRIYYWIDATIQFPNNTGIQRVSRQLARSLMDLGIALVPVKWDAKQESFGPVSQEDLEHFSNWNGPKPEMWQAWGKPELTEGNNWFFMPDLPLNLYARERQFLLERVRKAGLLSACVFFDAIPWKMRSLYPQKFALAHREYMKGLADFDLVLPISNFSCIDLIDFLGGELEKPQNLENKIKTVSLAGEFSEHERIIESPARTAGVLTVLCVGTVEPRKNHEVLLGAFARAVQASTVPMHLVIAGGSHGIDSALVERVRTFVREHEFVTWEEAPSDARLNELHLSCDFTVYPSIEEGFGLPILESLWYGKPCICANFGAMQEVAQGGGCSMIDVRDVEELSSGIRLLAEDAGLREKLAHEAVSRPFKSWRRYASEVADRLTQVMPQPAASVPFVEQAEVRKRAEKMHLGERPKLSICISTYNRADWLAVNLKNWARLYAQPFSGVELLVCDNASTDHTPEVVQPYLHRADFSYHRNSHNVGMLGNLRETAHHARGEYIWIIGDDDLLMPHAIETILAALNAHPHIALVYLNYAYTRLEDARKIENFDTFFRGAVPIVPEERDRTGPIRNICARNENFFTAIYTLVFRRDHAIRAYSQDTSGRPFSTMKTCIPTTYYVLNHMMEEEGVWIGKPQIVVNMNVSWLKYAPLWILERIPEVYEVAESKGVSAEELDRWRRHTLRNVLNYFNEIFEYDPLNNAHYFSPQRLVWRFKHLSEFAELEPRLKDIYAQAHAKGHPSAILPVSRVFPEAIQ